MANKPLHQPEWLNHKKGYTLEEVVAEAKQLNYFLSSFVKTAQFHKKDGGDFYSKNWVEFSNGTKEEIKHISGFLARAIR